MRDDGAQATLTDLLVAQAMLDEVHNAVARFVAAGGGAWVLLASTTHAVAGVQDALIWFRHTAPVASFGGK